MRSVFVFPAGEEGRTRAALDASAGRGNPWVVPADDGSGPAAYVRIDATVPQEWEPGLLAAVERATGRSPGWMVTVDLSGRVSGCPEVRRLVRTLLDGGGVAVDDSDRLWTADQIGSGG